MHIYSMIIVISSALQLTSFTYTAYTLWHLLAFQRI